MQPFAAGDNTSNIPAFLGKLWKMVNDPNTDQLICWSMAGNSFVIQNQAQFWYELLPLYYKHNNMSSFVRQLNMYGFHKMSTVENGTMDADKDEIQFYHRYFQKDQPELLRNIKRKVTISKSENNIQNVMRNEDITKVLTDVKQLRGRQSSVDSQLSAMKQENAVLWRELAMLRQKHIKQQQIVNKLIQFLVTLVQPSASSRIGVGVKRRMPLMLHGNPGKRSKTKKSAKSDNIDNGPTIHELDSEIEISPEELFDQEVEESALVSSPHTSTSPLSNDPPASVSSNEENGDSTLADNFWDKPEFVEINNLQHEDLITQNDIAEESISDLQNVADTNQANDKIFLNPNSRDTLLTNLVNGTYNTNVLKGKNGKKVPNVVTERSSTNNFISNTNPDLNQDMTVATRNVKINNGTLGTNDCCREDLDLHLETAQQEIDQLKDILHGCGTLDTSTLLGHQDYRKIMSQLFIDEAPSYGLNYNQNENNTDTSPNVAGDPMVSGNELVSSNTNLIDFNELFDDSLSVQQNSPNANAAAQEEPGSTLTTPMLIKSEPIFPSVEKDV